MPTNYTTIVINLCLYSVLNMLLDKIDEFCHPITSSMIDHRKKTKLFPSHNHKQHIDKKPSSNPFGPVVGNMTHVISCDYKNQRGEIYVASRALCFRRTALLGWEISRVIIPWESVMAIDKSDHGAIFIQTHNDERHEIHGFSNDVSAVVTALSDAWKRRHVKSEQDVKNSHAVNQLYRRLSLLSESDDIPLDSWDDKSLIHDNTISQQSFTGDKLQNLWSSICLENDSRLTENVAVVSVFNASLEDYAFFHESVFLSNVVLILYYDH